MCWYCCDDLAGKTQDIRSIYNQNVRNNCQNFGEGGGGVGGGEREVVYFKFKQKIKFLN